MLALRYLMPILVEVFVPTSLKKKKKSQIFSPSAVISK